MNLYEKLPGERFDDDEDMRLVGEKADSRENDIAKDLTKKTKQGMIDVPF